jgi:acyl-CoA synthetase (AMP-forming)/AMP-acid ligase II
MGTGLLFCSAGVRVFCSTILHYFALNALGCSVVLLNPDCRRDEIQFMIQQSDACLAVTIESRLQDLEAVSCRLNRPLPVVTLEDFPDRLRQPPRSGRGTPDGATEAALLCTSGPTGGPKGGILANEYFHTWGM